MIRKRARGARGWLGGVLVVAVVLLAGTASAQLNRVIKVQADANAASAQSQKRVDALSEKTEELLAEYRSVLRQIESLQVYNQQMQELIDSQQAELNRLEGQIEGITVVGRGVTPLMLRMIDALEEFVSLDVPFLPNERGDRIANLREIMARADVTDAEKYRRILEAYQIENEYGRTLEAYQGQLDVGGQTRTVDFLRVGRLVLAYQTLDRTEQGVWSKERGEWVALDDGFRRPIREGLRMARKQAAPGLLILPVAAPQEGA